MTGSLSRAGTAPVLPGAGVGEKLGWDAFSARYFPGRGRHHLDAVAAYGAYRQGRDWLSSGHRPPRLTLVPNGPVLPATSEQAKGAAVQRLLVALAVEQA